MVALLDYFEQKAQKAETKTKVQTDYNKLSFYDCSVISMICVGLFLIASISITAMPESYQHAANQSLSLLDVSDHVPGQIEAYGLMKDSMLAFYDEFTVAFVELYTFPDASNRVIAQTGRTYDQFLVFADSFAADYQNSNVAYQQDSNAGKVLGAIIDKIGDIEIKPESTIEVEPMQTTSEKEILSSDKPKFDWATIMSEQVIPLSNIKH